ncbi:MAG: hypothetical protein U0Q47_11940 [Mycobacterium sp.]
MLGGSARRGGRMPSGKSEPEASDAEADGLVSAEDAEAAAAEAEARAEAARTRANELRRKLSAAGGGETASAAGGGESASAAGGGETASAAGGGETASAADGVDDTIADEAEPEEVTDSPVGEAMPGRKRRLRLPGVKAVAAGLVILAIAGLLSATGWILWEHRKAAAERHHNAEYAAAARQGVVNLMSMDYTQAKESVQRVIDDSIGKFRNSFEDTSADLIKALQDSKMITKVTVNDTAVESMDEQTATVLVAATSHREGPSAPKEDQQPRVWRVVVTLERDGGQIKMSDVEFA